MEPEDVIGASTAELEHRLRQQALVAEFGLFALAREEFDINLQEACRITAEGLGVRFAKVLEFQPQENDFLLRAGVGWGPGVVGHVRLGGDLASPAGYAFHTGQPVISNHLAAETRFRTPAVLAEHGIHRAINVLISAGGHPYGVLEADSPLRGDFTAHDIAFLQTLANTIAAVVDRETRRHQQRDSDAFSRSVLDASPDCIKVLDATGRLLLINVAGLRLMEISDPSLLLGESWTESWPEAQRPEVRAAVAAAVEGGVGRFEASRPTYKGTPKWWEVIIAPVAAGNGPATRLVAISRDITGRIADGQATQALLLEKDLLMQEIHHRVKNSLQLVQNLLSLQARASSDTGIVDQLNDSAARVRTIAAIHDRLYRAGSALEVPIEPYLKGLIEDLQAAMASTLDDRSIHLVADAALWPAARVSTLGLVLTELVTNALKYGAGQITVTFRDPPDDHALLVVEDEGDGLPEDFDPTQARGMGMRLVTGMVRGPGSGITLDRSGGHTRFVVRLPAWHPPAPEAR